MEPIILWTGSGAKNATTLTLQENISRFKYYEIIFDVENNTNAVKSTGKIPIDKPALMDGLNSKALLMKMCIRDSNYTQCMGTASGSVGKGRDKGRFFISGLWKGAY